MNNPLLDFSDLPRYDTITPDHISPAIDQLLSEAGVVVKRLEAPMVQVSWDAFVQPLEDAAERLGRAWGVVSHMNSVVDTPELRAAYNDNLPKVTEFWTLLSQNLALFEKYKAIGAGADFEGYSQARKKIVDNALRDFRLGGAELADEKKQRFAEIQERLAALSTRFSENVLDATNDYALYVEDEAELSGLPEDAKLVARNAAEKDEKAGYKFTLHFPSFLPLMQYADNRALRETIYYANVTKASELGANADWDNTEIIREVLQLREEEAQLLGYGNYAEVSLVPKMAQAPTQVIQFLEDIASRARPFAERDLEELRDFAKTSLGLEKLEAWDFPYASEKLRQQRYAFSEQEVKQYFPEPKVMAGLFRVIEKLFSVKVLPDSAPVWHQDAKFFRIERDGRLLGQFYLDLYARNGKRNGAWMDDARGRRLTAKGIQTPVAYMCCNFSEPVDKAGELRPALFSHNDVITLFHEFGHGLHHLLTQVDELGVSGISGVEWDAVELPSQFMENFCWEWDVLQHMTAHADTGEPLPRALFDKMIAAKNFQSGLQMLRQVEFSLVDMHLHFDYDPNGDQTFQSVLDDVRARFSVVIPPDYNRFLHAFSHIFSGGYAAGYYSYKWAEVLSADAYGAFEEAQESGEEVLSEAVGGRFLKEILAVGGARPALESFTAFRGREPSIDALLRHNGMIV